jgi:hypothetical protein
MQLVGNGAPVLLKEAFDHFRIPVLNLGVQICAWSFEIVPVHRQQFARIKKRKRSSLSPTGRRLHLYLSDSDQIPSAEERIVRLDARSALLWVNEQPENQGSFGKRSDATRKLLRQILRSNRFCKGRCHSWRAADAQDERTRSLKPWQRLEDGTHLKQDGAVLRKVWKQYGGRRQAT